MKIDRHRRKIDVHVRIHGAQMTEMKGFSCMFPLDMLAERFDGITAITTIFTLIFPISVRMIDMPH